MPQGERVESAFAPVPARAAYVPRRASEAALAALAQALEAGERTLTLCGPTGMGKSLLLRLLEVRLPAPYDVLHVAPGALPLADLLAFALGSRASRPARGNGRALDEATGAQTPEATLVLPVDDAGALTESAARGLAGLVRNADGALRLVLAFDDRPPPAIAAALGGALFEVPLDEPLSEAEVGQYVSARLERAGASEGLRRRVVEAEAARLHEGSGGNPGRLNRLAAEIVLPPFESAAAPGAGVSAAAAVSLTELPRDPFGPTAAASLYQARASCERILGSVERELLRGRGAVLLRGPGGIGKTTLLRVLEARLRDPYQVVALPYARLAPDEFWSFVLHQLGAPHSAAPDREVLAIAARLAKLGHTLVILVDDGTTLPEATGESLAAGLREGAGALRLVLTADDEALVGSLPRFDGAFEIRVDERLSPAETEAYVLGRLMLCAAPTAVRRRFDPQTLAALHRDAGGLPREINRLAGEIERQALAPPPPARSPLAESDATLPVASASPPSPSAPLRPRAQSEAAAPEGWLSAALGLLPHIGLGLGIPLALLALWLWLAPLFTRGR
jgi:type II secretory pathway predicted ATPase ExeA